MKNVIFLTAFAVSCGPVVGADLPLRKAPPGPAPALLSDERAANWTGFYAGVLAGGGSENSANPSVSPITNPDFSPIRGKLQRKGAMGGFQAGYGFMRGSTVMGVEADLALTTLRGKQKASGVYNNAPAAATLEGKTEILETLRGRIGYAVDDVLIYGTGGVALALQRSTFTVTTNDTTPGLTSSGASRGLRVGWVLGLGAERFFLRDVSGKLEYLYAHVGDGLRARSNPNGLHILRGGVNYHF